jgi:hypothetical protein
LLCALAACGGNTGRHARVHYAPSRYYAPPGPASDPWGPYIREASGRFGVPELWIRRVMRQESGGQEDVVSWVGAMGLMQVMPDTYEGLRYRYSLGGDPFDPHNNILAGTAYLREMYDRYGSPGFLAAYNAGPNRLDSYLRNGTPLPTETVNYVASIAPLLGPGTPMSGPLAVYAGSGGYVTRVASRRTGSGCDPDAAYNPDGPCTPLQQPVIVAAVQPVPASAAAGCDPDAAYNAGGPCTPLRQPVAAAPPSYPSAGCDPDAAYNPNGPCTPLPAPAPVIAAAAVPAYPQTDCDPDAAYNPNQPCRPLPAPGPAVAAAAPAYPRADCDPDAAYNPNRPCRPSPAPRVGTTFASHVRAVTLPPAQPVSFTPGHWAIQVGAFANLPTAMAAAENARGTLPDILRRAKIELPPTAPFGDKVAYRARLSGLTSGVAADACARLSRRRVACMTVPPTRDSF